ncbi:hypothetical protein PHYSODRAFT_262679 [Phytophthora sojae]|uniref:Uncharacterized protein n=1 Tax=Phytophthora sojae (strain P6497) TaxID=1094619 RepID=G5A9T5_PHYSP|nr:hypothetical protein PHYSODRAFT_262679 [Phytophthora sojae]EGZ07365.1 hypothetical protein PHYSODRAFT_262679 [Phytophthora sojae]|eukprot:XP_009536931.1 hypothetical protein PHYSODRAFT_262679 [Phytophthora sojae]
MQSLWFLCISLGFLGWTFAASDGYFNVVLKLYWDIQYKNSFATIKFKHAGRCYSLDCESLGDKAASAKWDKLPNSSSDTLVFYSNADCTGLRGTAQLAKAAGVTNFKKLTGQVSSFTVKTKATTSNAPTTRISSSVCDWISLGTEVFAKNRLEYP